MQVEELVFIKMQITVLYSAVKQLKSSMLKIFELLPKQSLAVLIEIASKFFLLVLVYLAPGTSGR